MHDHNTFNSNLSNFLTVFVFCFSLRSSPSVGLKMRNLERERERANLFFDESHFHGLEVPRYVLVLSPARYVQGTYDSHQRSYISEPSVISSLSEPTQSPAINSRPSKVQTTRGRDQFETMPGRRRAHDRRTDDATSIIGEEIELDQEHDDAIHTTEKALMSNKCRTNYRNRMNEMIQWLERKYPQYWVEGTRELTEVERANKRLHHHTNKRDFVYAGLNVRLIKGFLSEKKVKTRDEDGNVLAGDCG